MADMRISDFPAASALVGGEKIAAVQGGANVAVTPAQLAAHAGASDFQRQMRAAMKNGFTPERTPRSDAPTASLTSTPGYDPPSGFVAYDWTTTGYFRTRGGFTRQYGSNLFLEFACCSPLGNGEPHQFCNRAFLETIHTGAKIHAMIRGNLTAYRWIVDGAYVDTALTWTPNDGNFYLATLDFGGASATRSVILETDGTVRFHAFFVGPSDTLTEPTGALPRVHLAGTSLIERPFGWSLPFTYRLGVDGWNCGIGSSGILQPGLGGRVKMRDRSIDYTGHAFDALFLEGIINDTDPALYADTSYTAVEKAMRDEVRRNIDLWAAAQGEKPFIATGYWPTKGVVDLAWPVNDGLRQACSEYRFAWYSDPFEPAGYLWPVEAALGTDGYFAYAPGKYWFGDDPSIGVGPDSTHPNEYGALALSRLREQVWLDAINSGRF